jgi:hypothetical protein
MHTALLYDVIQRQAGTLTKAIVEGICNSVDAKATRIDITCDGAKVTIADNGIGFRSKREIVDFFETFGQPHDEAEGKRYGQFRMGRGQVFSYGANSWRTGKFSMEVDVKNRGLDYTLTTNNENEPGCKIVIDLYDKLEGYEQRVLEEELAAGVCWLNLPVYFNGDRITKDPNDHKWQHETDEAYFNLSDRDDLQIYSDGILVKTAGTWQFGVGGLVVSKQQMRLNFARNDILSDCPIWAKIKKFLDNEATCRVKNDKKPMTASQRARLCRDWKYGKIPPAPTAIKVFRDVKGRWWSIGDLVNNSRKFGGRITSAPAGDMKGDRLMQQKIAIVLDADQMTSSFDVSSLDLLLKNYIQPALQGNDFEYEIRAFEELTKTLNDCYDLLSESEWSPLEAVKILSAETASGSLRHYMQPRPERRRLTVGQSDSALAWTDGETYIAFDRKFLAACDIDLAGWCKIATTLLHEYCHNEADSLTHVHSPEFYELYHNSSLEAVPAFVSCAFGRLENNLKMQQKRFNKKQLKVNDSMNRTKELATVLAESSGQE